MFNCTNYRMYNRETWKTNYKTYDQKTQNLLNDL